LYSAYKSKESLGAFRCALVLRFEPNPTAGSHDAQCQICEIDHTFRMYLLENRSDKTKLSTDYESTGTVVRLYRPTEPFSLFRSHFPWDASKVGWYVSTV